MTLEAVAATALLSLSSLLGVKPLAGDLAGWRMTEGWHEVDAADGAGKLTGSSIGTFMSFTAETTAIPDACRARPNDFVVFPAIIQGSHVIRLDGRPILRFGDPTFRSVRSFYGEPVLSCSEIVQGRTLAWTGYSYTTYFARVSFFPKLAESRPAYNVFAETFHIVGAGTAIVMAIFTFTVFGGKASRQTTVAVSLSSLFASLYLGGCVAGFMGVPWSMLTVHKVADLGAWASICLLLKALHHEGLVSRRILLSYVGAVLFSAVLILLGETGDAVQFGTTIPFVFTLGALAVPMVRLGRSLALMRGNRIVWLQFLSLGSYVLAVFNEMFAVSGLIHTSPMLPFGTMCGVMFLALAVNERVNEAYLERDFLRSNLETEVGRKTVELKAALSSLQLTQAELVQSAKLAALGTLSAGIAHEINNSLNYVNGALQPLERLIEKGARAEDRPKIDRLLTVMKEGLHLTLEIIRSLRNHTGLNQAKFNDVRLRDAADSSLAILRSRIRGRIEVQLLIPDSLVAFGSVVGLNQVFINLIGNAIDAMEGAGSGSGLGAGARLTIEGESVGGEWAVIRVRDSGSGMSPETQRRIFEPFFTTKEVGRGTGLGLHIVLGEVERHGGAIEVESRADVGTCFTVRLPIHNARLLGAA